MARPSILALGTAVPPNRHDQGAIGAWMRAALAHDPALARWLGLLYARSGIAFRHTCLPDLLAPVTEAPFAPSRGPAGAPSTAQRMRLYHQHAPELALQAVRPIIEILDESLDERRYGRPGRHAITHLIAISCTGLYAPGLDLDLALRLRLRPDLRRTMIGFMGCAAGITGLRLAAEIVQGDPEALVLVIATELCTLHLQPTDDREALLSAALFGDGAGAALVGIPSPQMPGLFQLDGFQAAVTPDTASEMVWTVGDHGFALRLSPHVPAHLAATAPSLIASLLGAQRPAFWAVHPGGKGILDRLAQTFGLSPADLTASRWVLRERGNLSSATIFHVLARLAEEQAASGAGAQPGVAAAFGPGLVTELAALTWLGPPAQRRAVHATPGCAGRAVR
jgi:predicted naringenin-chalcone synthase